MVALRRRVGFYVAGGIVFQTVLHESSASFPSAADILWLGLYVCDLAAVAALMRARGIARKAAWLDGAVGSLAVGAAAAAFAFEPALDAAGNSNLVAVAYPLLDCLLIGFVIVVASAEGWRLDRTFGFLALGFVGLAGGDAQYLVSAANGTGRPASPRTSPMSSARCSCASPRGSRGFTRAVGRVRGAHVRDPDGLRARRGRPSGL